MTAADDAYAKAEELIAEAKANGWTDLNFNFDGYENLERIPPEIAELTGLQSLGLIGTQVSNLGPLNALIELQVLGLSSGKVSDLAPLRALTSLQHLDLGGTQVSDLGPLSVLTELHSLDLLGTPVSDLTPLSALTGLQSLNLSITQVSDLSSLIALTRLEGLFLNRTPVSNLGPLSVLSALQYLDLSETQVSNFAPLSELTGLHSLDLFRTQLSDLGPLSALTGLLVLDLSGTQVSNLSPLSAMTKLQRLFLRSTQVFDISPVADMDELQVLALDRSNVLDLRPVASIERLGRDERDRFSFEDTPATRADPRLHELSQIDDDVERAAKTKEYLATLPPWPEPLPYGDPEPPEATGDLQARKGRPAPVMVRRNAEGRIVADPPGIDLEDAARDRAEGAWTALRNYFEDLVELRARLHNMPALMRAFNSFERAMGDSFATLNQYDLGMQADRLRRLARNADTYLMDEDPEELAAFTAQLAIYMRRFNDWEIYQNEEPLSPEESVYLKEDGAPLQDLVFDLADPESVDPAVTDSLNDVIETGTDPDATDVEQRGTLDSAANVLVEISEAATDVKKSSGEKFDEICEGLQKESAGKLRDQFVSVNAVAIFFVTFLWNNRKALEYLAARYPTRFSFLLDVLNFLFPR